MKIPPASIDNFLTKQLASVQAVLLYGVDAGLISERVQQIVVQIVGAQADPFRLVELSFNTLKDDPALLADEIAAFAFGGGRRLIKIRDASAALPKALQDILASPPGDAFVVMTADELTPASTLRGFFEKASNVAALPCYKDEAAAVRQLIDQQIRTAGYAIEQDALQFLQEQLAVDRLLIRSEVDKLLTYKGDDCTAIMLTEVEHAIGHSAELPLDSLCDAVAGGNRRQLARLLDQLQEENMAPIAVLRMLSRYFLRLHYARSLMMGGASDQEAIQALKPPVFFKQVPVFKQHLRQWDIPKLVKALELLNKAELECKKTGAPAERICHHTMLMLPLVGGMR